MRYLEGQGVPGGHYSDAICALHSVPAAGICDNGSAHRQRILARELDLRHRDLLDVLKMFELTQSSVETRALGPLTMQIPPPRRKRTREELTVQRSWETVFDWQAVAEAGDDLLPWVRVMSLASSIVPDDVNRRLGRLSMQLDESTLPAARALERSLLACLAVEACDTPSLPKASHALNPAYTALQDKVESGRTRMAKRLHLQTFADQVRRDLSFSTFIINDSITVVGNRLVLPLDAGDFAGFESELAHAIESVWNSDQVQVQVRWVKAYGGADVFRFVAHNTAGRAFVNPGLRTINLFSGVTPKTIAHEVGHVIGLPDHYYTTWNELTCSYTIVADADDIMSDHETGGVTAGEWDEIVAAYF